MGQSVTGSDTADISGYTYVYAMCKYSASYE